MIIGFGSRSLDFQPGLQIIGSTPIRSIGFHDELRVKAMVFETRGEVFAIVSLDLLCVDTHLCGMIRNRVATAIPVTPERIMVVATHTHGGPGGILSYLGGDRFQRPVFNGLFAVGEPNESLLDKIAESSAEAAELAYKKARKAVILTGRSKTEGIGSNREVPGGPFDPDVTVVAAFTPDGRLLGMFYHYACHPTVLTPGNPYYTADFTGMASSLVEDSFGENTVVMFLNGACGDVSTRYTRSEPTFAEAERFAGKLSHSILEAFKEARPMYEKSAEVRSRQVALPGKLIRSDNGPEELSSGQSRNGIGVPEETSVGFSRTIELGEAGSIIRTDMLKSGLFATPFVISAEIQVLSFGEMALVGVPGELFAEYGLQLKSFPGKTVCTVGYANGYVGYLTSAASHDRMSYESLMAVVEPGRAAGIIVEEAISMLR